MLPTPTTLIDGARVTVRAGITKKFIRESRARSVTLLKNLDAGDIDNITACRESIGHIKSAETLLSALTTECVAVETAIKAIAGEDVVADHDLIKLAVEVREEAEAIKSVDASLAATDLDDVRFDLEETHKRLDEECTTAKQRLDRLKDAHEALSGLAFSGGDIGQILTMGITPPERWKLFAGIPQNEPVGVATLDKFCDFNYSEDRAEIIANMLAYRAKRAAAADLRERKRQSQIAKRQRQHELHDEIRGLIHG